MRPLTRRYYWLLFVFLIVCSTGHAQWLGDSVSESHLQKGIGLVYDLSFDSAQAEFRAVERAHPDHPAGYFFLAMVDWWKIVTDIGNTSHDEHFIGELDHVIDLCDKRLDANGNDTTALFFKGGSLGFEGRLFVNREDWLKAANAGREALPIVQKAAKLAPENTDILLGTGIYNYYAAVVPEQYPFVKPLTLFFPKGNRVRGLDQLRTAAEKARYAGTEAKYVLLVSLVNFEHAYGDALILALQLHAQYPNNALFHRYVGRCYASASNWDEMNRVFKEILDDVHAHRLGYDQLTEREANYYLGLHAMEFADYDSALSYFYRADELSRVLDADGPSGFMTATNLRIGMIYDLQGKRDLAITQYRKVLDMKDYMDAHKQAQQYLTAPYRKS
ncbi:MAG TPA: hypothetical protein VLY03_02550 [Bacteroidota bacterium]|nr:hypothetical protein [Bacteroidota bacterium]